MPKELSGGEKQRIGFACALSADPPIILMDEPFAALDPINKEQLQNEFLELESEIKKTVVYVTHDIFEAIKMADRIALLHEGKLVQIATPAELVKNPKNEMVEKFLGPHKFQLSLMTETIGSVLPLIDKKKTLLKKKETFFLSPKNSFLEALDLFKEVKKNVLPIFSSDRFEGFLEKEQLLSTIFTMLKENK